MDWKWKEGPKLRRQKSYLVFYKLVNLSFLHFAYHTCSVKTSFPSWLDVGSPPRFVVRSQ